LLFLIVLFFIIIVFLMNELIQFFLFAFNLLFNYEWVDLVISFSLLLFIYLFIIMNELIRFFLFAFYLWFFCTLLCFNILMAFNFYHYNNETFHVHMLIQLRVFVNLLSWILEDLVLGIYAIISSPILCYWKFLTPTLFDF